MLTISLTPKEMELVMGCLIVLFALVINPWRKVAHSSEFSVEGGSKNPDVIMEYELVGGTVNQCKHFAEEMQKNPPEVTGKFVHNDRIKLTVHQLGIGGKLKRFAYRVRAVAALCVFACCISGCGDTQSQGHVPTNVQISNGSKPVIYAVNKSAADPTLFRIYIEAQNRQLAQEFQEQWGFSAILAESLETNPTALNLLVLDHLDPLYNHLQGTREKNIAYCNYALSVERGTWQVTCSHEVLELLAEARGVRHEICDPVAPYGYADNLADFCFPQYWAAGSLGPWDYLHMVPAQGQPAKGGVQSL